MRNLSRILLVLAALAAPAARADLSVFATVPEWAALAQEVGGEPVTVYAATNAMQDPHRVEARPSLVARARSADIVVATGAELETGWLPLVLQQSGNAKVRPGTPGYFEAASFVPLLGKPTRLDRSEGDIHPQGDPHIQLDPRNILKVGEALAERFAQLDPPNAHHYRTSLERFRERWQASMSRWRIETGPLKGVRVVVQHKGFTYLIAWLGMEEVAALEPKPGMEPTTAHLSQVLATLEKTPAKMVLRAAYQNDRASQWLAQRAKIAPVALPFTVGGTEHAKTLFSLFEDTIKRLLEGAK